MQKLPFYWTTTLPPCGRIGYGAIKGGGMTRQEALKRLSELSCAYQHIRMTECPHCAMEVESLVRKLIESPLKAKKESLKEA